MGNHDALFVTGLPQPQPEWMSEGEVQHQGWIHACLAPELRSVVARWPYELQFDFEGIKTTFVHYGLQPSRRDFVPIIPDPTPTDLEQMFEEFSSNPFSMVITTLVRMCGDEDALSIRAPLVVLTRPLPVIAWGQAYITGD